MGSFSKPFLLKSLALVRGNRFFGFGFLLSWTSSLKMPFGSSGVHVWEFPFSEGGFGTHPIGLDLLILDSTRLSRLSSTNPKAESSL